MPQSRSLSIIIPAYNEAFRIAPTIDRIRAYAEQRCAPYEIIVVDDGSLDATADVVSSLQETVPALHLLRNGVNRGKGASVRAGMLAAKSELLLMCDADISTPIEEYENLLVWLERGIDVVIASRAMKGSLILQRQPCYREIMGKIFGMMARFVAVADVRDHQCGFKLLTRPAAHAVFSRTRINRFAFDVEVLFLAKRLGYQVKEVPVQWSNSPQSRVRLCVDTARMAVDLLRIRAFDLAGRYR